MLFKEVMLSQEETEIFQKFHNELKHIDCGGLPCDNCPLAISGNDSICLMVIIGNIIRKHGYKEDNKDEQT